MQEIFMVNILTPFLIGGKGRELMSGRVYNVASHKRKQVD